MYFRHYIRNGEDGQEMLARHRTTNKEILDASLKTFDEGRELLVCLRGLGSFGGCERDVCASIESLLEQLNGRRCYLEEVWLDRRLRVEQSVQICELRAEIAVAMRWLATEGEDYLEGSKLGECPVVGMRYITCLLFCFLF